MMDPMPANASSASCGRLSDIVLAFASLSETKIISIGSPLWIRSLYDKAPGSHAASHDRQAAECDRRAESPSGAHAPTPGTTNTVFPICSPGTRCVEPGKELQGGDALCLC